VSTAAEAVADIPDFETNGYVFTDGVGRMSMDVAQKAAKVLGLPTSPSAVQFRMGGGKGMLSAWSRESGLIPDGVDVMLRPSQIKFPSKHRDLEIVGYSRFHGERANIAPKQNVDCQFLLIF
jgi:RNA-dependent RNA polymerase